MSDELFPIISEPFILEPDNFTPLEKTPWAGTWLAATIKKAIVPYSPMNIGESWEVSCDPTNESRLRSNPSLTLSEIIKRFPVDALSPEEVSQGKSTCEILVKLLNAASPLSLQIHPADGHPMLRGIECGKPESWLVLKAEKGAGIYLGFSRPFSLEQLKHGLLSGQFDASWLNFVPIAEGDYFEISPGVPHAIGAGSILLEPQRIKPSGSGVTWRMWDWNRKYDERGFENKQTGLPRKLHIEESLSLLQPSDQTGADFVQRIRKLPTRFHAPGIEIMRYPANQYYQVYKVKMSQGRKVILNQNAHFAAVTIIEGGIRSLNNRTTISTPIHQGVSAFFPWKSLPAIIESSSEVSLWTALVPATHSSAGQASLIQPI